MKALKLLLVMLCMASFLACQSQQDTNQEITDSLLQKIGTDEDYIAYSKLEFQHLNSVFSKDIDLVRIDKIAGERNVIDVPVEELSKAKGGKEYFDLMSKMFLLREKLEQKYPILYSKAMNTEWRRKLKEYCVKCTEFNAGDALHAIEKHNNKN